jgi:hypothetical protein
MSPETARKIVVMALLVGSAATVWQGQKTNQPTTVTYKRLWGLLILVAGGAVLADLVPAVVGPYIGLVLLVMLTRTNGIGSLFKTATDSTGGLKGSLGKG